MATCTVMVQLDELTPFELSNILTATIFLEISPHAWRAAYQPAEQE